MKIEPVTLTGTVVRLEPLQRQHAAALFAVGQDPSIWTYMPTDQPFKSLSLTENWIDEALAAQSTGIILPFAIIDQATDQAVGSTRFLNIVQRDRGLEIGWTWLTPAAQRTGVNTECKYLLLRHGFEQLEAIRIQLKTHHNNLRSQRAIERIGAVREGIFRNHMIMPDGHYRHSVFYSIIESEWPQVKANLEAKMLR